MARARDRDTGVIRIRPDVHRRLKVISSMGGDHVRDIANKLIEPHLDKLEADAHRRYKVEVRPHRAAPLE